MKKSIRNYDLNNKKVIIRCDFNVPLENNKITDNTRIISSLKTINYAKEHNAKIILMSHLGKVKAEEDKQYNSLYPVSKELERLLNQPIIFLPYTRGKELSEIVNNLKAGEILLIENTRYEDIENQKESSCNMELAAYWASLGDIFINDAFGTIHRKHASNYGIASYLPNGIGFLIEEETKKIDDILSDNTHPFILIMGGKKVSDKIPVIRNIIDKCDKIIIGGAMSFTFLKVLNYNIGKSIIDNECLDFCKELLSKYSTKIILPIDVVTENTEKNINELNNGDIGYDIGSKTIKLFKNNLQDAKRVIINGPMGMFEETKYEKGTKEILEYLSSHNIKTLIGGGDSAYAVNKFNFNNKFYHVSTGGGATLEYLSGINLPSYSVINDEKEK